MPASTRVGHLVRFLAEHETSVLWSPGGMAAIIKRLQWLCTDVRSVVELADASHWCMPENPAAVSADMLGFLAVVAPPGPRPGPGPGPGAGAGGRGRGRGANL